MIEAKDLGKKTSESLDRMCAESLGKIQKVLQEAAKEGKGGIRIEDASKDYPDASLLASALIRHGYQVDFFECTDVLYIDW